MHQRTRSNNPQDLQFDPDIEGIARRNRWDRRRPRAMGDQNTIPNPVPIPNPVNDGANVADERILQDYVMPRADLNLSSIRRPTVNANNFEIKPSLIQMIAATVQFAGNAHEDPNVHLQSFNDICDTFRYNGVSDNFIKLKLFPFSLIGEARGWLQRLPPDSIITWEQLAQEFLNKYFPPGRAARLRNDITNFTQYESESLYDAWERFKDLVRKCPHHGLLKWQLVESFYTGISNATRTLIDAAAGGSLMKKSEDAAYGILEELSSTNSHWGNVRQTRKAPGMIEMDDVTALKAQVEALTKQMSRMRASSSQASVACCDLCFGPHGSAACEFANPTSIEQVAFVNYNRNFPNQNQGLNPQNNPYSNTYNPAWRQNQALSWKDNTNILQPPQPINQRQPPGFQVQQQPQAYNQQNPGFQNQFVNDQAERKPSLEDMFSKYMGKMDTRMDVQDAAQKKLENRMEQIAQNSQAAIHNLEVQVGQLAKVVQARQQGSLPSNTEINPKSQCMAISLRNGKQVELPKGSGERKDVVNQDKKDEEQVIEKENMDSELPEESSEMPPPPEVKAYIPPIPYPQRLKKQSEDKNSPNFLRYSRNFT